jgi:D-cysteine desulfhydrase
MPMISPLVVPTPVQRIECAEAERRGNVVYLKRDDLLPFSFGGNKVRIACEFVKDLRDRGCDALVMYGDRRSNLCRVLANLCSIEGIPCVMVATDADGGSGDSLNARIVDRFGVEVLECAADSIAATVDRAFRLLAGRGLTPYYIYGDRTGMGNEGTAARAYASAYPEIGEWERSSGTPIDLVVTPYGTGCTQGGLVAGSLLAHDGREIVGISISSRPEGRALSVLRSTVRGYFEKEGLACPEDYADHIHLETKYTCGGYGVVDERVVELVETMLRENSVPMDPTYTGKAFRGMLDWIEERDMTGKNILFLHTGGLPLFFDYLTAGD